MIRLLFHKLRHKGTKEAQRFRGTKGQRHKGGTKLCPFVPLSLCLFFVLMLICQADPCVAGYQFLLTPKFSLSEEYTDNLLLDNTNKESDFITVFSPGIVAKLWDRTSGVTLEYSPGYSLYSNFSENNTLRHTALLYGKFGFSRRTQLSFRNTFLATEDPVAQTLYPSSESEDKKSEDDSSGGASPPREPMTESEQRKKAREETIRKSRKKYYTDNADINLNHQFGRQDNLNLKYAYTMLVNQDETIEDEKTHNPSVMFNYWAIPSRLALKAAAAYTHSDFSETSTRTAYSEESITPSAGVSYWFIPRNFGIDAGVSYRKGSFTEPLDKNTPEPGSGKDEESINPTFGINYRYLPYKLDMNLSLSYMEAAFSDPTKDFDNWYGTIKISKTFSSRLSAFVQYAHTIAKFAEGGRESYNLYDPSVGVTYLLGDKIPLTLSMGYFIRDMEISDNESALSFKGNTGKAWTFGKTTLNLSANSGYDQSYFGANALGFGVFYDLKAAVQHHFSRDTMGDISVLYRKDKYLDEKTIRNDEDREAGMGMTWFLFQKWASVRLGYTFKDLSSTREENSYTENRLSLIFTASHPRLLRIRD